MSRKATIITIYDPRPNYGNRLQNYASQMILKSLNLDIATVAYEKRLLTGRKKIKYILQKISGYHLPGNKEYWKVVIPRLMAFDKFNRKYINTVEISDLSDVPTSNYYVLGSDQVWNTAWYDVNLMKKDLFLLTFAKPEQKICFSPSFSVTEMDEKWLPWFREHLATFPSLGVREESGAILIKEMTGKEAQVTLDPTLMLNASDWRQLAAQPKKVDCSRKYILTYFLGGHSERVNADLERYSKEIGAHIYNLLDTSQPELYKADPAQFIYLIDHAQLVLTDSFHACVFSFLLGKPFLVYNREGKENNMMSRMDTLLGRFDLKRKYADSGLENSLLECDYSNGYKTLEDERKKTLQFLKNSMNLQ